MNYINKSIYAIFIFDFKINIINSLNTISYYNFSYSQYPFIYPKYEAPRVFGIWLVTSIYFSTKNLKPEMYLRLGQF